MTNKPELTPIRVPVNLASGKNSTGIRYKAVTPAPGPGTPSAGPATKSPAGPTFDRARDRGYVPGPHWEADQQMVDGVRGEGGDDFPKGVDDRELIVRYHELLLIEAKKFPYDRRAGTYIVGADEEQDRQAPNVTWGAWGEIEDKCFWEAAMELSERAGY